MLSPADMSELDGLQAIFEQIDRSVAEIKECPAQLLEQARGKTSGAVDAIHKILQQEVTDTAASIEVISAAVCTLQSLIEQITNAGTELAPKPPEQKPAPNPEPSAPQKTTAISEEDVPLVLDFIAEAAEHLESAEAGLLALESKPGDKEVINQIFRGFHTIKGMAGFLNLTDIGSLAHSAENLLDLVRKDKLVLTEEITNVIFESIDMLKKMIAGLKEAVETGKAVPVQEKLPVLLTKLKNSAQGQPTTVLPDMPLDQKKDEKLDAILTPKDETETKDTAAKTQTHSSDDKIKVSTARLDNLINMVGELVIAQLMVAEETNTALASEYGLCRKVAHQGKIIRELQELSMSMRMVPIGGVFQKMTRLVRDLSHKAGKEINFLTAGDETELDRSIVDKISDPLVHMIRNSVDHGIESSEDRVKAGKNPIGRINLRAFHQAGNIVIEIEDDGKGLDKERILKKAVDMGIVSADEKLSDEEIFRLIFHAGLSTAQKVTSISGRGVGMDVVRKNIELLRGRVDISSSLGKGTTFTIRLPLTLAIIDGQIVSIGSERYIVPITSIICSIKPTAEQISSVQKRGEMVTIRGALLPMVRLYKLFGVVSATENPTDALLVIVEEDNKKCCLLVDKLLGQQQVVIKSLGEGLGMVKGVSGGAIMGDGRVSLILDVPGLIKLSQN
jgi:two-component system chemotaxis sensor kinase CheA